MGNAGVGGAEHERATVVINPSTAHAPRRTRIVLAQAARRGAHRDGLRAELTEQTQIGDALVRGLVRAQLSLAWRLSMVVVVALGALPLLFTVAPAVGSAKVLGVSLPWLLLGGLAFPFLLLVGWVYMRLAERNERDFTDLIRRSER